MKLILVFFLFFFSFGFSQKIQLKINTINPKEKNVIDSIGYSKELENISSIEAELNTLQKKIHALKEKHIFIFYCHILPKMMPQKIS